MNIHAVSKGVVLYFALIFALMTLFIFNDYALTERMFTLSLLGIIALVGFVTGKNSGEYAGLNGFLIGIITSSLLIFFISPYEDMNWSLNYFIMIVWITASTASAYAGGKINVILKMISFKTIESTKKVPN